MLTSLLSISKKILANLPHQGGSVPFHLGTLLFLSSIVLVSWFVLIIFYVGTYLYVCLLSLDCVTHVNSGVTDGTVQCKFSDNIISAGMNPLLSC